MEKFTIEENIINTHIKAYCKKHQEALRILAMDEAKTAKISSFWKFWPVIQLIDHLSATRGHF